MAKKTEKIENKNSEFIKKLNTKFGRSIASTLKDSSNSNIKEFISTGSTVLDVYLSNRENGGWCCGRLNVIEGSEATGKSLLAAHAAADVLKRGGTVLYVDTEHAVDMDFFKRVGVDVSKMIYVDGLEYMEQIFELIEKSTIEFRNENPDDLFLVIWDSVSGIVTQKEWENSYEDQTMGAVARVLSTNLRKIIPIIDKYKVCLLFVNQLRNKIARQGEKIYGDPLIGTGGRAIPYYASMIIRLRKAGEIKDKEGAAGVVMGVYVNAKVTKTRLGPPFRNCDLNIYFNKGVDDVDSWLDTFKIRGIIKTVNKQYVCEELSSERFQGPEWKEMIKDPEFVEKAKKVLVKGLVVNYDEVDVAQMIIENVDPDSIAEVQSLADQLNEKE